MINKDEYYAINKIMRQRLIPWVASYQAIKRIVKRDLEGDNILKTITFNFNNTVRYKIKGENLINYINVCESKK